MKLSISLWIFGVMAIITNFYIGYLFFPGLMMLTQYYLAILLRDNYYYVFYGILFLLLISVIVLIAGLFKLRRWAYYIFITLTLLLNSLMFFIYIGDFFEHHFIEAYNLIFIISTICFIIYFLKPSTRRLFDR